MISLTLSGQFRPPVLSQLLDTSQSSQQQERSEVGSTLPPLSIHVYRLLDPPDSVNIVPSETFTWSVPNIRALPIDGQIELSARNGPAWDIKRGVDRCFVIVEFGVENDRLKLKSDIVDINITV